MWVCVMGMETILVLAVAYLFFKDKDKGKKDD